MTILCTRYLYVFLWFPFNLLISMPKIKYFDSSYTRSWVYWLFNLYVSFSAAQQNVCRLEGWPFRVDLSEWYWWTQNSTVPISVCIGIVQLARLSSWGISSGAYSFKMLLNLDIYETTRVATGWNWDCCLLRSPVNGYKYLLNRTISSWFGLVMYFVPLPFFARFSGHICFHVTS